MRKETSIKGVVERSSVFASEIFTVISQIPEEPPEVINMNEMHKMPWKEMAILDYNRLLLFLNTKITKKI